MKICLFSSKSYDEESFKKANEAYGHSLTFHEDILCPETAQMANGFQGVCAFVNDDLRKEALENLKKEGISSIGLRCTGYNNVDVDTASDLKMQITNVPKYSPYAVAEHTAAMMLCLNRKIHRAYNHVREGNFSIEGLLGFDMHGKKAGVIGAGAIGRVLIQILQGFGCKILAYDVFQHPDLKGLYVDLPTLFKEADIISLHCPLTPETHYLINKDTISQMKPGVMVINTGRGALIETQSVIEGVKSGQIGSLGLDVYEEESLLFFRNLSHEVIQDDVFARLLTFPNVLITSHQGFFTREALTVIAETTLKNFSQMEKGESCQNSILRCDAN